MRTVQRNGATYAQNVSNIGGPSRDVRRVLDDFPTKHRDTIWQMAVSESKNTGRNIGPDMMRRIARSVTEAADLGYSDVGGEQTPLSGHLSWEDSEAVKRQKTYIRDHADKKKSGIEGTLSDDSVEWYTPPEYVEAAREVMGAVDLDPASNPTAQELIGAKTYYTKETNGLANDWTGRVWLNPPWGRACAEFVAKALHHYERGDITEAVLLLNSNSNDAGWFQPLFDHTLCFTRGRIDYYTTDGERMSGSTHGSVFVYLGHNWQRFADRFSEFGNVVKRVEQ